MNFKDKELLIFDFDGTLINSVPDLTLATNMLLRHYKLAALTIEEVTPFIGNGAKALAKRALKYSKPEQEITDELLDDALNIYVAAYKEISCQETYLYPGVLDTLKYLQAKGYKMMICTNKPYEFIEPILDKLEIKQYFDSWIGENSLPEKKPSGAPLLHLAEEINTTKEKCIMVGDSKNDILSAQNAGMDSIGVSYGYNYNENIADYKPTIVLDNFAKIQNLL